MRFIENSRKTKCKRCGESKICFKDTLKGVNICPECLEEYKKARVNCSSCKKSFKREEEFIADDTIVKNKNFCCEKCYNDFKLELEEKDKMDKWLKEYFKVETLPSRIYMQMDDFKTKKGISYRWTFATLRYIVKIQGRDLENGTIGIVPYVVDECREYVRELENRKKKAKESEENKTRFTDNTIVINMSKIEKKREEVIDKMLIKEEDLEGVILW